MAHVARRLRSFRSLRILVESQETSFFFLSRFGSIPKTQISNSIKVKPNTAF